MMLGLNPAFAGALAGVVLGLLSMAIVQNVAARMEEDAKSDRQRATARLLRNIAWLDVLIFAVAGYFIGPMILS